MSQLPNCQFPSGVALNLHNLFGIYYHNSSVCLSVSVCVVGAHLGASFGLALVLPEYCVKSFSARQFLSLAPTVRLPASWLLDSAPTSRNPQNLSVLYRLESVVFSHTRCVERTPGCTKSELHTTSLGCWPPAGLHLHMDTLRRQRIMITTRGQAYALI
jgi:hypothetical protein